MMAYNQQPQTEYAETSTEMKFAAAVGVAVAAWQLADQLAAMSSMASWDWIILFRSVAVGLFVGGVAYALAVVVMVIAPGLPALLLQKAEDVTGLDLDGKPKRGLPTGQPKREPRPQVQPVRQPLEVEPMSLEDEADPFEELPQWMVNTDKMVWPDRLNINGHLLDITAGFDTQWLYTVAEKRAAGQLDTISPTRLDSLGISRWSSTGEAPAAQVVAVLEAAECVKSKGDRQPYEWD
jgi:hypothetical protein